MHVIVKFRMRRRDCYECDFKELKNVMSFHGNVVSTGQLYKALAEKHKCRMYSN